jgi:RHS repeat-associated protein
MRLGAIILGLMFSSLDSNAAEEKVVKGYTLKEISSTPIINWMGEDQWFNVMSDPLKSVANLYGNRFRLEGSKANVRLWLDDRLRSYHDLPWSITVTYDLQVKYADGGLTSTTYTGQSLTIDHAGSGAAGTVYNDIDVNQYDNAHHVKILNIVISDPDNVLGTGEIDDVHLDIEMMTERFYELDAGASSILYSEPLLSKNELLLTWDYIEGAEQYDLEWVFVDDPDVANTGVFTGLPFDFENATRITLNHNFYHLSLGYPRGTLVYRVRAVGYTGTEFKDRVDGDWSYVPAVGTLTDAVPSFGTGFNAQTPRFYWEGLDTDLNWQYQVSYAEQGKRREAISYFDGALRARQSVTILNTDQNAIIGQTHYDYLGRPSLSELPVPVESQGIRFYEYMSMSMRVDNTNPTGYDYFNYLDFDLDANINAPSVMNSSVSNGASNYYSSLNAGTGINGEFTPDANGRPYARTLYKNDGTGRIRVAGNVGDNLGIGSDHETKYYYGTPTSQFELDRLFGNEVGYFNQYKKNMVIDANGQTSVAYHDQSGRVVATALAGSAPLNLHEIDTKTPADTVTTSLTPLNNLSEDNEWIISHSFLVPATSIYTFYYELNTQQFCGECLLTTQCKDCIYDFKMVIVDECGVVITTVEKLGVNELTPGNTNLNEVSITLPVQLAPGSYTVHKILTVNQTAMLDYGAQYLADFDASCIDLEFIPPPACSPTCTTACFDQYGGFVNGDGETVYFDDEGQEVTDLALITQIELDIDLCVVECINFEIDIPDSPCDIQLAQIMTDMSPGGQYFSNLPEQYLSTGVHNPAYHSTHVPFYSSGVENDWLNSNIPGFDDEASGAPFIFGQIFGHNINNWDDVAIHWNDAWLTDLPQGWPDLARPGLIYYHPEYCAWQFFCDPCSLDFSNGGLPPLPAPPNDPPELLYPADELWPCYGELPLQAFLDQYMDEYAPIDDPVTSYFSASDIALGPYVLGLGTPTHPATINLLTALHGTFANDPAALIGTGPNQITPQEFFDNIYYYYRDYILYYYFQNVHVCHDGTDAQLLVGTPLETGVPGGTIEGFNEPITDEGFNIIFGENPIYENWPDPTGFMNNAISDFCADNCGTYADQWMAEIEPCISDHLRLDELRQVLIAICQIGCSPAYPGGHSNGNGVLGVVSPDGIGGTFTNFDQAIAHYNSTYGTCATAPEVDHPPGTPREEDCLCGELQIWLDLNGLPSDFSTSLSAAEITAILDEASDVGGIGQTFTSTDVLTWFTACNAEIMPSNVPEAVVSACIDLEFPDYSTWEQECDAALLALADYNYDVLFTEQLQALLESYLYRFEQFCLNNAREIFTVTYELDEYHYTLYYYDQAGDLVKTVPPQGVDILNEIGQVSTTGSANYRGDPGSGGYSFIHPNHLMVTNYRYTTTGALIETTTPDGGRTEMWYDEISRPIIVQNERQLAEGKFSYIVYDELGRPIEGGEITNVDDPNTLLVQAHEIPYDLFQAWITVSSVPGDPVRSEVIRSFYDDPINANIETQFGGNGQTETRNQVSTVAFYEVYDWLNPTAFDYDYASHYSYDLHGNVNVLLSEMAELEGIAQNFKRTEYDYDLVSGNVNEVRYQPGKFDQFSHRYCYDADNRITNVFTSADNEVWEQDGKYFYYAHGPLARSECGDEKVQATDFAYTLQGWLKGVNSNLLNANRDLGHDGIATDATGAPTLNAFVAADATSFSLAYHNDDYTAIGDADLTLDDQHPFAANGTNATLNKTKSQLFNGNIGSMTTTIPYQTGVGPSGVGLIGSQGQVGASAQAMAYEYDQLNRLKDAQAQQTLDDATNNWGNSVFIDDYQVALAYDGNGNIETLSRFSNDNITPQMDNLLYNYYTSGGGTTTTPTDGNRLAFVTENANGTQYGADIENQTFGNYQYDELGQLKADVHDGITRIDWTYDHKIRHIRRENGVYTQGTVTYPDDLEFRYDASRQRVVKIAKGRDNAGFLKPQKDWVYTYYVRDAAGNVMATYKRTFEEVSGTSFKDKFTVNEHHLYGSKRLGIKHETSEIVVDFTTALTSTIYTYDLAAGQQIETIFDPQTITIISVPNDDYSNTEYGLNGIQWLVFNRELGHKAYEMTNHLGNVLATTSDRKTAIKELSLLSKVEHYTADVLSYSDYYPFGMQMPGRNASTGDYRYGFNGMEHDPEVSGDGNSYTTEFRSYDPRLGRWKSLDPLMAKFPNQSPYVAFDNNPIYFNDPNGLAAIGSNGSGGGHPGIMMYETAAYADLIPPNALPGKMADDQAGGYTLTPYYVEEGGGFLLSYYTAGRDVPVGQDGESYFREEWIIAPTKIDEFRERQAGFINPPEGAANVVYGGGFQDYEKEWQLGNVNLYTVADYGADQWTDPYKLVAAVHVNVAGKGPRGINGKLQQYPSKIYRGGRSNASAAKDLSLRAGEEFLSFAEGKASPQLRAGKAFIEVDVPALKNATLILDGGVNGMPLGHVSVKASTSSMINAINKAGSGKLPK